MKNFKFHSYLVPIIGIILLSIDQLSKSYILENQINASAGFIQLFLVKNSGIIGGSFSHLSPNIRIVFLSTFGIYLFALYLMTLFFLRHKNLFLLKSALSLFIYGIIGNVIDKTFLGFVVDFINLNLPLVNNLAFNISDIFIITGFLVLIYSLYFHYDELWPVDNRRKSYLIEYKYQLRYVSVFIMGLILFSCTVGFYSYSYLNSFIASGEFANIIDSYFWGMLIILILFSLIATLFIIIYTHRSVGPIKALIKYADDVQIDPNLDFKLREGDFHTELKNVANQLKDK